MSDMVQVHRVTLMAVDFDGFAAVGVAQEIEAARYPNDCLAPIVVAVETRAIDWTDDHPLNSKAHRHSAFKELFGGGWIPAAEREPQAGARVLVSHAGQVFIALARRREWVETDGRTSRLYPQGVDDAWMPLPKPWEGGQ